MKAAFNYWGDTLELYLSGSYQSDNHIDSPYISLRMLLQNRCSPYQIVIDCIGLQYMHSAYIGFLVYCLKLAHAKVIPLVLTNVDDKIKLLLVRSKLESYFMILSPDSQQITASTCYGEEK